jgi:hypothetical protein
VGIRRGIMRGSRLERPCPLKTTIAQEQGVNARCKSKAMDVDQGGEGASLCPFRCASAPYRDYVGAAPRRVDD